VRFGIRQTAIVSHFIPVVQSIRRKTSLKKEAISYIGFDINSCSIEIIAIN
jgi:hypothetical protein